MLSKFLNVNNFIWLNKGIKGDDTHGHIDDICRFVSPDTIMTAVENNKKDVNYKILQNFHKICPICIMTLWQAADILRKTELYHLFALIINS